MYTLHTCTCILRCTDIGIGLQGISLSTCFSHIKSDPVIFFTFVLKVILFGSQLMEFFTQTLHVSCRISSNKGRDVYLFSRVSPRPLYGEGLKSRPDLYYFCSNGKRRESLAWVHAQMQFLTPPVIGVPSSTYLLYHPQEPRPRPTVLPSSPVHARLDYIEFN